MAQIIGSGPMTDLEEAQEKVKDVRKENPGKKVGLKTTANGANKTYTVVIND